MPSKLKKRSTYELVDDAAVRSVMEQFEQRITALEASSNSIVRSESLGGLTIRYPSDETLLFEMEFPSKGSPLLIALQPDDYSDIPYLLASGITITGATVSNQPASVKFSLYRNEKLIKHFILYVGVVPTASTNSKIILAPSEILFLDHPKPAGTYRYKLVASPQAPDTSASFQNMHMAITQLG